MISLEQCEWCGRERYPNQLLYSEHQGGWVCRGCVVDQGPDHIRDATKKIEDGPSVVWVKEENEWGI